jgi:hypothetical protein
VATTEAGLPWTETQGPPDALSSETQSALRRLEPLRRAWETAAAADPEDFEQARIRSLRRHAIETGIIERLYDVSWGVTEALVADGLLASAAEREGGLDADALAAIRDQYDALEYVATAAREDRPALTVMSFANFTPSSPSTRTHTKPVTPSDAESRRP